MGEHEEPGSREAEILAARRAALQRLEAAGMSPYAITLDRALGIDEPTAMAEVRTTPQHIEPDMVSDEIVTVAGRVVRKRDIGKLQFLVLRDRTGDLQVVASGADLPDGLFALLGEVDLGDIIGV